MATVFQRHLAPTWQEVGLAGPQVVKDKALLGTSTREGSGDRGPPGGQSEPPRGKLKPPKETLPNGDTDLGVGSEDPLYLLPPPPIQKTLIHQAPVVCQAGLG